MNNNDIKLIFYGENPAAEYEGDIKASLNPKRGLLSKNNEKSIFGRNLVFISYMVPSKVINNPIISKIIYRDL